MTGSIRDYRVSGTITGLAATFSAIAVPITSIASAMQTFDGNIGSATFLSLTALASTVFAWKFGEASIDCFQEAKRQSNALSRLNELQQSTPE